VKTGIFAGDETAGQGTQGRHRRGFAPAGGEATENAGDVAIECGRRFSKGDAGDRAGGIIPNPGKFA